MLSASTPRCGARTPHLSNNIGAHVEKARAKVKDFRAWIAEHKDELTALQVLYAGTRPLKLPIKELRQLRDALARPPLSTRPTQLWRAFEAVDVQRAKERGSPDRAGETLPDLVQLVRHAIRPDEAPLSPYAAQVRINFGIWMMEKERAGVRFTAEQAEWLWHEWRNTKFRPVGEVVFDR